MISILKTVGGALTPCDEFEEGVWVSLTDPTDEELAQVADGLNLDDEFLRAALDEEESARLDSENGQTLIIVDMPTVEPDGRAFVYSTLPLGIVMAGHCIVTVCARESNIIEDFERGRVRSLSTNKRTRFLLQLLYRIAKKYLQYLKQIDKATQQVEEELHKSMKNRELIQMMRLEKSLVFFSTSLKGNDMVMERLLKTEAVKKYPDDTELLEDVIIENKQAIEMCSLYRDILSGTMDAFASIISNNLNIVMKLLAAVTILMAVPQIFGALWGMNVAGIPFEAHAWGFWIVAGMSFIAAVGVGILMWKKKMF